MKKALAAMALILMTCVAAAAQEFPRTEIFGGYSLAHLGFSDSDMNGLTSSLSVLGLTNITTSKLMKAGFDSSVTFNFTGRFQ